MQGSLTPLSVKSIVPSSVCSVNETTRIKSRMDVKIQVCSSYILVFNC